MIDRVISVIDTHTAGEPTRIIVGGLPRIRGNSMLEKRDYFENNYDQIRTMVLREPRGHNDMFGAALVEPVSPDADLGVIFLSTGDYLMLPWSSMPQGRIPLLLTDLPALIKK
jgi:proline racemase